MVLTHLLISVRPFAKVGFKCDLSVTPKMENWTMHALVQKHSPHHKQQLLTLMARWGRTFGHVAFRHPTPLGPNTSYTRSVWAIVPSIMARRSQATTLERQLSARIGEQIKYASGERGLHITCYSTCMGNYQTASCSSSVGPSLGWAFYLRESLEPEWPLRVLRGCDLEA
jgi:hypothetical protein